MTLTEENYLKTLYHLSSKNDGEITISSISDELDVSKPTVNSMIKKLSGKGFVNYKKYKPLTLTSSGKKAAALIVRKHRLTEMFLVNVMDLGWEEVHEIAEQIEHIESPKFFNRMDELLGKPAFDPHGSPIPDEHGVVDKRNLKKLSECEPGDQVIIKALNHSSKEFLTFLNNKRLALGTSLTILERFSFDQSMRVSIRDHEENLSERVCESILVST